MPLMRLTTEAAGRVVARSIEDSLGRVLLREGTVLTPEYVRRLADRGYRIIDVKNELAPSLKTEDVVREQTRAMAISVIADVARDLSEGRIFNVKAVVRVVDRIIEDLLNNPNLVVNLESLRCLDDYTYTHSVNVCILTILLRKATCSNPKGLRELGTGAILHDIGKLSIPPWILKKPSHLSDAEFEMVKGHCEEGAKIISRTGLDPVVSKVALRHHERMDGSGYPKGLSGEDIHLYGRICAVADVYDALTSDRVYRDRMPPSEAMKILEFLAGGKLDEKIVAALLEKVAHYPVGTIVRLNTGEIGIVIAQDPRSSRRPVVMAVTDDKEALLDRYPEYCLVESPSILVTEVLDDYPHAVKTQAFRMALCSKGLPGNGDHAEQDMGPVAANLPDTAP